jgi:hypothetical protein
VETITTAKVVGMSLLKGPLRQPSVRGDGMEPPTWAIVGTVLEAVVVLGLVTILQEAGIAFGRRCFRGTC